MRGLAHTNNGRIHEMNEARRTSPPDDDWNEIQDHHEEAAKAELADDPGALWDVLEASSWYKEHVMALFAASEQFRNEVYRENSDRIIERAQEIADEEARQNADEYEFERAEMLREGDR